MNAQQKIVVVIVDILVIVELCISMYSAAKNPDTLTPAFVKCFMTMVIPTLIMARVAIRRLKTAESEVRA